MAEEAKHKRYKEAIMKFIDGKIITIQKQVGFGVLGCQAEENTLHREKERPRRRHDIIATVAPFLGMPKVFGKNVKPVMLPAHGGDPKIKKEQIRCLIEHGAEEGMTLVDIFERLAKGKSVGRRPPGEAPREKYPWHELIIEICDTSQKTAEHKDEIQENGQYAIEINIKNCPDRPSDSILENLIAEAKWLVNPDIAMLYNAQLNYKEQAEAIKAELKKRYEAGLTVEEVEKDKKFYWGLLSRFAELLEGIDKSGRQIDDLREAKGTPGGQVRFDFLSDPHD